MQCDCFCIISWGMLISQPMILVSLCVSPVPPWLWVSPSSDVRCCVSEAIYSRNPVRLLAGNWMIQGREVVLVAGVWALVWFFSWAHSCCQRWRGYLSHGWPCNVTHSQGWHCALGLFLAPRNTSQIYSVFLKISWSCEGTADQQASLWHGVLVSEGWAFKKSSWFSLAGFHRSGLGPVAWQRSLMSWIQTST